VSLPGWLTCALIAAAIGCALVWVRLIRARRALARIHARGRAAGLIC
jgi:hypothetical protein